MQSKIYSNSRVRGHGRLEWLLLSLMSFVFTKLFDKGKERTCLKYRKGTGKDVSTIWRWSGRINKIGLPHPSVLCCGTLLKYLLQQRYRDVIEPS